MNVFGKHEPTVKPLDLSENQFEIYNKISRNYSHSFLFESLTGPEELAETSIMGFDPEDRKSTRLNSSHSQQSRMPSSA